MSEETSASAAVIHMLDGGLVPAEGERAPLRRVEMAAIWRAEAEAELQDAICEAKDAGVAFADIGVAVGITGEAVRNRYVRAKLRSADPPV